MAVKALIPHLVVNDGVAAAEFYKKAFDAVEVMRMPAEDGKRLMHLSMKIGDAPFMACDDFPEYCGGVIRNPKHTGTTGVTLHLVVDDCDTAMDKAVAAGATLKMPATDMFWGDRYGQVLDPFGHEWSISTPLSPERAKAAAANVMKM